MPCDKYEGRAAIISLLREAHVVEEIVEDVADAVELADYTILSLASEEISIKTLADTLYLTKQEAMAVKKVAHERLESIDALPSIESNAPKPSTQKSSSSNTLPDFSKMISVHVIASHADGHQRQRSGLSIESFLGRDVEKKKVYTSSCESGASGYQWTDSMTDHETSVYNDGESSKDPASSRQASQEQASKKGSRNRPLRPKNKQKHATLTDKNLADHDSRRPFVPRLQLEDAGLSYGPPNSICLSYTSLDSLSPSDMDELAEIAIDYPDCSERVVPVKGEPLKRGTRGQHCLAKRELLWRKHYGGRPTGAAISPLPSYRNVSHSIHKTTASFEASKRALKEQREHKERMRALVKENSLKYQMKKQVKRPKRPSSSLLRPTKASLARVEEIKKKCQNGRLIAKAGSTSTIPSTLQVLVFPDLL